jgi:protein FAM50
MTCPSPQEEEEEEQAGSPAPAAAAAPPAAADKEAAAGSSGGEDPSAPSTSAAAAGPGDEGPASKRVKFSKLGKDPGVATSFLPDKDREMQEEELRQQLKRVGGRDMVL